MGDRTPAPGGGAVAAVTLGLAAGLVEMAAGYLADESSVAASATEEARRVRARATELAAEDADAFGRVLTARRHARDQLPAALTRAADVPLEVAELAARTAQLAAALAADGKPDLRADAVTGLLLAESVTRAAAHLVAVNLEAGGEDAGRLGRARQATGSARSAVTGYV